ncbi:hypothetical protein ACF2G4_20185 (plasmid) [Pantoea sp. C3]|uniref:hypothetical protein n=1 Tax=Pantoea phytostimulans TaxID=2769024 RepID=UPI0038F6FF06
MTNQFINANPIALIHPEDFESYYEELSELQPGDSVEISTDQGKLWVIITKVRGEEFKGTVNSYLSMIDLDIGDEVSFKVSNIFDYTQSFANQ